MKNILHLLILFFLVQRICFAQIQFQVAIGGTDEDAANSIIQTTDGGYAVAGHTLSFGAYFNMYIVKLDSNGILNWSRIISNAQTASSIIKTIYGGYAVAGTASSGSGDMCLVILDNNGVVLWNITVGTTDHTEHANSVIQTADSGYALAGSIGLGFGYIGMYIVKLNRFGELQWNKTIAGETGANEAWSILQTPYNNYVVVGETSLGVGHSNFLIVKLDSGGNLLWSKTFGGTTYDYAKTVIQSSDGGYVVAGYGTSFGPVNDDVCIVKFAENGNFEWCKTFGGPGSDRVYSIVQTSDGGYAVAGEIFATSINGIYLAKLDSDANLLWREIIGGTTSDRAYSIIQTIDHGYAVAGATFFGMQTSDIYIGKLNSNGYTCGNISIPSSSPRSSGIVKSVSPIVTTPISIVSSAFLTTGTGGVERNICLTGIQHNLNEVPASYSLFQNYPNPFNPTTKIKFNIPASPVPSKGGGQEVSLKIYDILGKEVASLIPPLWGGQEGLPPGTYEVEWNGSNFPSGVYFYKLSADSFSETKKLILLK